MSDLISRSALINALKIDRACIYSHVFSHVDCDAEEELMIDLVQIINNQPTIEAAPVEEVLKVVKEVYHNFSGYDLEYMTKYGNKTAEQQHQSYSSLMMYEIAMEFDDLIDRLESMK